MLNESPVLILDLDDVLANYTAGFLEYISKKVGMQYGTIKKAKNDLGRYEYARVKNSYRSDGVKRDLSLVESEIPDILDQMKKGGFEIAVVSSRPVQEFVNVRKDTMIWLGEKRIPYDHLFFSKRKHLILMRQYWDRRPRCYVVEDDPFYAKQMGDVGFIVFWLMKEHTQEFDSKNIFCVVDFSEAIEKIKLMEEGRK